MSSTQSKQLGHFPKTVVLGASGRLAKLIRPFWEAAPITWQSRTPMKGCKTVEILQDPDGLVDLLRGAETVICLAGVTPAPDANFEDNLRLAKACLDAAQHAQAGHVLLTSSAAAYGVQSSPLREDTTARPISLYGRSKLAMEQLANAHPHPSTALRIGNVAGADAALGGWKTGAQMDQLPNGKTPARSYIGPETLARVLQALANSANLPKILNIAAPESIEMGALLSAAGLPFTFRPATSQTIANVALDTNLLETFVSFDAKDSSPTQMVREWREATKTA